METHIYKTPPEHGIAIESKAGTYKFCLVKYGDAGPDDVHHGDIPILQYSQARCDSRDCRMSYSNEQHEYCATNV